MITILITTVQAMHKYSEFAIEFLRSGVTSERYVETHQVPKYTFEEREVILKEIKSFSYEIEEERRTVLKKELAILSQRNNRHISSATGLVEANEFFLSEEELKTLSAAIVLLNSLSLHTNKERDLNLEEYKKYLNSFLSSELSVKEYFDQYGVPPHIDALQTMNIKIIFKKEFNAINQNRLLKIWEEQEDNRKIYDLKDKDVKNKKMSSFLNLLPQKPIKKLSPFFHFGVKQRAFVHTDCQFILLRNDKGIYLDYPKEEWLKENDHSPDYRIIIIRTKEKGKSADKNHSLVVLCILGLFEVIVAGDLQQKDAIFYVETQKQFSNWLGKLSVSEFEDAIEEAQINLAVSVAEEKIYEYQKEELEKKQNTD